MLELLSLRKGTTLTKEMFLNHLYGGMDEPELKIIDVFICKLRKKLAIASNGRNYIETVWGRGYVLREPSPKPEPHPRLKLPPDSMPRARVFDVCCFHRASRLPLVRGKRIGGARHFRVRFERFPRLVAPFPSST